MFFRRRLLRLSVICFGAMGASMVSFAQENADLSDLRRAYDVGEPGAALALGTALLESDEDAQWAQAIALLEQAASQGAPVYLLIADAYRDGLGVPVDLAKAANWYRIGAETGDGLAQLELGRMYLEGLGLTRDMVQAALYLQLASDRLTDPRLKEDAEAALAHAKWGADWKDWQEVKLLLQSWKPKRLSDLLN